MPAKIDPRIPDLVSVTETAAMLRLSRQAVLQMIERGDLPGRKVGSTWVFRLTVVEERRRQRDFDRTADGDQDQSLPRSRT